MFADNFLHNHLSFSRQVKKLEFFFQIKINLKHISHKLLIDLTEMKRKFVNLKI